MSIEIEIDPHGLPQIPFSELRGLLLAEGRSFTKEELSKLPYVQIRLAAIANAGAAACSLSDVIEEKQRRRSRFMNMSPDTRLVVRRYLKAEGMFDDVEAALEQNKAPRWEDCSNHMKLWLKLNCLHNHTDIPTLRLREAHVLVSAAEVTHDITTDTARYLRLEILRLLNFPPQTIDRAHLRDKVSKLAEEVLSTLTDEEWITSESGLLRDYSCTSDCYRAL